ncbi:MAG: glycosyltransferase family 39 protein [Solirubrobacterales bacterium]|nr:glycosyltransferase family 39 protein [Solirubrobacterales bacterium]
MDTLPLTARQEPAVGRSPPGRSRGGAVWSSPARVALPVVIGLSLANFGWQLGSSSYYVDEVQSVTAALAPLGGLLHGVSRTELSPPAYFYFLHEWLVRLGSDAEWVARIPSALGGGLLVVAVYWLASLTGLRRTAALGAAALTGASPFVLEYAQRAQPYLFVMLAVTVAAGAVLAAERDPTRSRPWLAAAAAASMLAIALHYTAALVLVGLCWRVIRSRVLTTVERGAYVVACACAALALVPLAIAQHRSIPIRTGVADSAGVTIASAARVLETPFAGRIETLPVLGCAVMVAALLVLVARGGALRERQLVLLLAAGEPLVLLVASALGAHLMLTRYAAVAAPFMLLAIAAAGTELAQLARPAAALLVLAAAVAAAAGLLASHRRAGFELDARDAVAYLGSHTVAGQAVLAPKDPGIQAPLVFYGVKALNPIWARQATFAAVLREQRRPTWAIVALPSQSPTAAAVLAFTKRALWRLGLATRATHLLPGVTPVALLLEVRR